MKILISGSMQFYKQMLEAQGQLEQRGHTAITSKYIGSLIGQPDGEIERIKLIQKFNDDAIREYWDLMQDADALLVLNYDKHGIKNYIGGNTLMEIGFAYVLKKKIFLLNPIPEIPYYQTEIEAVRPIVLHDNLDLIGD